MKKTTSMLLIILATFSVSATVPVISETRSDHVPGSYQLTIDTPEGVRTGVMNILNKKGTYSITLVEDGTSAEFACRKVNVEGNKVAFYFFAEGYDVNMNLEINKDKVNGYMMWEYKVAGNRIRKPKS